MRFFEEKRGSKAAERPGNDSDYRFVSRDLRYHSTAAAAAQPNSTGSKGTPFERSK
jgi:hypothetical protein